MHISKTDLRCNAWIQMYPCVASGLMENAAAGLIAVYKIGRADRDDSFQLIKNGVSFQIMFLRRTIKIV